MPTTKPATNASGAMRIAIRDQGSFVAAYLANEHDLKGAVLVATIAKKLAGK